MKDRILALINAYNLTSTQFADEIDSSKSKLSHIFSGRNNPSLDVVTNILENFPEVNPDWLILGKGKMFRSMENNDDSDVEVKTDVKKSSYNEVENNKVGSAQVDTSGKEKVQEQESVLKNGTDNINMKDLFADINKFNLEFSERSNANISKAESDNLSSNIHTDSTINAVKEPNIAKSEDKVEYKTNATIDINAKDKVKINKIIVLNSDGTFEEYCKS